jgi:hypothetical protein
MNEARSGSLGDVVFAAVLALTGAVVAVQSLVYGLMDEGRLGPGAVPFGAGVALTLTAGFVALRALRGQAAPAAEAAGAGRRSFALFALLAGALLLSGLIGLVPAAVLFVFVTALAIERLPLVKALVLAAVAALIIWAIFILLLDIPF